MDNEPIDDELARISDRIRSWREERGLSRQQLADRSGVAVSTVHKVEAGQMVPSIAVVLKLAHGLGRRPSEILAESDSAVMVSIQRAGERLRTSSPAGEFERLSAELVSGELEVWRVALCPAVSAGSPLRFAGEVFVACEEGHVTFTIGSHDHVLASGDVAHFTATLSFTYRNDTDTTVRFLLAATLPPELRSVVHAHAVAASE